MGWMYEVHDSENWCTSDEYDTKEDAIEDGKEYFRSEHYEEVDCFDVGEAVKPDIPRINAEWVIEHVAENMFEEVGEVAEDWLTEVSEEDLNKIDKKLNRLFIEWLKETNNMPDFFTIRNVKTIYLDDKI